MSSSKINTKLDKKLLNKLYKDHKAIITIEEGAYGGFGSVVLKFFSDMGVLDDGFIIRTMNMPDKFIDHATPQEQLEIAKIDLEGILSTVRLVYSRIKK